MKRLTGWLKRGNGGTEAPPRQPVDLLESGFLEDPAPTYAWLRRHAPVAELAGGGVVLTRHADILAAFTSAELGNAPSRFSVLGARNRAKYVAAELAAHIPPFLDRPEHILPRQALTRSFHDVFRYMSGDIQELAEARVAAAPPEAELLADISRPFACAAMARFVGLESTADDIKLATHAFFTLFAPLRDPQAFAETNAQMARVRAVLARALAARRLVPGHDLLSEMLRFQADNPDLSDAMIVDNAILILADGVENIEAGIASLLRVVLGQPGLAPALARGDADMEAALREALRLETPGQIVPRVARAAFSLHGNDIAPGLPVFLALAGANRDPEVFDNPNDFRLDRENPERVFTFGRGRHRCIGEALAMTMFAALLRALCARDPVDVTAPRPLTYAPRFGHRWPMAMKLRFRT